ncbi:MAG: substrate-binding domain-containing protein [Spirochaetales bacterium]|nr:substrate-binding domain-containing protein [Spirochaetales bacterium]
MKKVLTIVLMLALVCGFAFANGGSEKATTTTSSSAKGVIYGIYKAGDQTWFIDEGDAAKAKANELGYDFIYVDAKMNPEEYLRAIDNAIANKAAGIVTCIPDQTLSQAVVDKLADAKIPVVAADDALQDASGKKIAPWVGINAYVIGEANGAWIADYVKKNNLNNADTALLIMTMDTVSSCVPRAEGEYDKFTSLVPDFNKSKIYKADYDGTTDKGYSAADAVLTAHPEIKTWLVTGANEEGTVGALRALEAAGKAKTAAVVGLGAYMSKDEWNTNGANSGMKASAYFSAELVGAGSVTVLDDIINGKSPKLETAVDAIVVTPETYKSVMGKAAN